MPPWTQIELSSKETFKSRDTLEPPITPFFRAAEEEEEEEEESEVVL